MDHNIEYTDSESWLDKRYKAKIYRINEGEDSADPYLISDLYKMGFIFSKDDRKEILNLHNILDIIPKPVLIVLEPYYVDMLYRDSYYHYYSEILTEISRNCSRLSFFKISNNLSEMIDNLNYKHVEEILLNTKIQEELADNFVGTVTLRPLYNKIIGRVLLDPSKLEIYSAYLRRTHTMVTIYGHGYDLKFFPLACQDGLYMTCAETSLWMIFEYFGLQYSDYHTVLPSEFIDYNAKNNPERTLPALGMNATTKSKILKNFGIHPKIYALNVYEKNFVNGTEDFYMLFHIYVESGIPLVLSLLDDNGNNGHSVICIGHGAVNYDILDKEPKNYVSWENEKYNIEIVDSSKLVCRYIIMDDTSIPYQSRSLEELSLFDNNKLKYFIAPLNRKVYMDAQHATELFSVLATRYLKDIDEYLNNCNTQSRKVIRRIYLTTARKYKAFRTEHGSGFLEKEFYASLPCAKFIWVMEMGIASRYKNGKVFAEFVLDATGGKEYDNVAIIVRIGNKVGYHGFDEGYMVNKEIISDSAFDRMIDYCKSTNSATMKNDKSYMLNEISSDDSLLAKYIKDFDENTIKYILDNIYNMVMKFIEELHSGPNNSIDAKKNSIKLDIENFIFSILHEVYGESLFINSAESIINERFVNCSSINIFDQEFDLYKNNLDYVDADIKV